MKIIIFLISLSFFNSLQATLIPQTKEDFCSRFSDSKTINTFSNDPHNYIDFKNSGGLFNGGVCWWHSKFQRNLFYLSIFHPYDLSPTKEELRTIIRKIRLGNQVVIIPGYFNVKDFTAENHMAIQKELEAWQIYDGVVLSRWIDGLSGKTKTKPELLKIKMDTLYQYVEVQRKIAYQKLQIKGITSHAWLVVAVKPMPSGYDLEIIDSNHPRETEIYSYKFGDDSFFIKKYGSFVPYLEYTREEAKLVAIGKRFCEKLL
jgi:hypothetical protein